jgi:hypothetical protein
MIRQDLVETEMNWARLPAIVLALCVSTAALAEISVPDNPKLRDFPKGPRGSIALYATIVAKGTDNTIIVMKGFIWGQLNGQGTYVVHNPTIGITCNGTTRRMPDSSGQGDLSCSLAGQFLGSGPLHVPAGVYGKLKGTSTGGLADANGKKIGTFMTRWAAGAFPDPLAMIDAFK